jgi:hypothetical protein
VADPSIGVNPSRRRTLPTGQNPVSATLMEIRPVAVTPRMKYGLHSSASVLLDSKTIPAINQTVRSMYQR